MVYVTQACRALLFDILQQLHQTFHRQKDAFCTNRDSSIKNANYESQNSKVYCTFCLHDHRNSSTGSNRQPQLGTSVKMLESYIGVHRLDRRLFSCNNNRVFP